jgi:oxygen-independent coproporphyrinogen-3 oxidase
MSITDAQMLPDSGAKIMHIAAIGQHQNKPPIIITHGTFSSYRVCLGLAQQLAKQGFPCYIMEWPERSSDKGTSRSNITFDSVAAVAVPETIDYVKTQHNAPIFWIGHSGGGLVLSIYLARNPSAVKDLLGLVLVASQASEAALSRSKKYLLRGLYFLVTLLRFTPGKTLNLGPENEGASIMQQWFRWNIKRCFVGMDGKDYVKSLKNIVLPLLAVVGTGDSFIAPEAACIKFANLFGSNDCTVHVCGKKNNFSEDFSHSRIMLSSAARREVWPLITEWLHLRLPV